MPGGMLAALPPVASWIDMTSMSPVAGKLLAEALLLASPVSSYARGLPDPERAPCVAQVGWTGIQLFPRGACWSIWAVMGSTVGHCCDLPPSRARRVGPDQLHRSLGIPWDGPQELLGRPVLPPAGRR